MTMGTMKPFSSRLFVVGCSKESEQNYQSILADERTRVTCLKVHLPISDISSIVQFLRTNSHLKKLVIEAKWASFLDQSIAHLIQAVAENPNKNHQIRVELDVASWLTENGTTLTSDILLTAPGVITKLKYSVHNSVSWVDRGDRTVMDQKISTAIASLRNLEELHVEGMPESMVAAIMKKCTCAAATHASKLRTLKVSGDMVYPELPSFMSCSFAANLECLHIQAPALHDVNAEQLVQGIKCGKRLTALVLEGKVEDDGAMAHLAGFLASKDSRIECLTVKGGLGSEHEKQLVSALKTKTTLRELDLQELKGCGALMNQVVVRNKGLRVLRISASCLRSMVDELLETDVCNNNYARSLEEVKVLVDGSVDYWEALEKFLSISNGIRVLRLTNFLEDRSNSYKALLDYGRTLEGLHIESIDSFCLGSEACEVLTRSLRRNKRLEHVTAYLQLESSRIGDGCRKDLLKAIMKHRSLQTLNFNVEEANGCKLDSEIHTAIQTRCLENCVRKTALAMRKGSFPTYAFPDVLDKIHTTCKKWQISTSQEQAFKAMLLHPFFVFSINPDGCSVVGSLFDNLSSAPQTKRSRLE